MQTIRYQVKSIFKIMYIDFLFAYCKRSRGYRKNITVIFFYRLYLVLLYVINVLVLVNNNNNINLVYICCSHKTLLLNQIFS